MGEGAMLMIHKSLPHGGAWIETKPGGGKVKLSQGRSLTGERGLKQVLPLIQLGTGKSLPHGGAWIETWQTPSEFKTLMRRSLTGERGLKLLRLS